VATRAEQRDLHPTWHNAPVPPWGDDSAPLLIIGLAPGRVGANRTGLPFWGDHSGDLLMEALARCGAADLSLDPPRLQGVRLANAVACFPPKNRPTSTEVTTCGETWLRPELLAPRVILCLGRQAHESTRRLFGIRPIQMPFHHGAILHLDERRIVSSYHPSPLNTRTGRLQKSDFIFLVKRVLRMAGHAMTG
jgi:uracil-DNA glycosylase family 4